MQVAMQYANMALICLCLAVLTVSIHMYALFLMRWKIRSVLQKQRFREGVMRETGIVSIMVVGLCTVHIVEILVWAAGYVLIGALRDPGDALYYSLTMYTTVGPEGVTAGPTFRGVGGFESLLGPMMLAWSTAFLVEYVTQVMSPHPAPGLDQRRREG